MNFTGETDLQAILETLDFDVPPEVFVFCVVGPEMAVPAGLKPFATVREREGLTLVLSRESADRAGLHYRAAFRCISLRVHSSLEAVGLTAAIAGALARKNISANVIAGYYHDHFFVPEGRLAAALDCLRMLQQP